MRTIPAGPSAHGMRNGPAISHPRALFPARGRTRNCERRQDAFIADSRAEERSEHRTSSQGVIDFFAGRERGRRVCGGLGLASPTEEAHEMLSRLQTSLAFGIRPASFSRERILARISFFRTFPTFERGRSGQMSTCFGALTLPIRPLTK